MSLHSIIERIKIKATNLASRIRDPRRNLADIWLRLDETYNRLLKTEKTCINDNIKYLTTINEALVLNSPAHTITMRSQELAFHHRSLAQALKGFLDKKGRSIRSIKDRLDSLNPLSILQRGYSITRKLPEMNIVKDSVQVKTGDEVSILLARGSIKGLVKKTGK